MSFDFTTLITDRSQDDVETLNSLLKKPLDQWTEDEATSFWSGNYKGSYGYSDMNRVINCLAYLAQYLTDAGYIVHFSQPGEYQREQSPTAVDLDVYRSNIEAMRKVLPLPKDTPDAPANMENLTLTEANNIEKILLAIEDTINRIERTIDLGWAMGIAHIGLYGSVS